MKFFWGRIGWGIGIFLVIGQIAGAANHGPEKVIRADSHALFTDKGRTLSLEELHWIVPVDVLRPLIGHTVRLDQADFEKTEGTENRYGDQKGIIEMDRFGWLQAYWVSKGFAIYNGLGGYPPELRRRLLQKEVVARKAKKGGWRTLSVLNADQPTKFPSKYGFKIVEGKVISVKKRGRIVYLNFGDNWRDDFTASISSKNLRRFTRAGWNFDQIVNKWIRVRGQVRPYNGPYMELIFPEQVEMLSLDGT